ncbi:MAG: acyl-CoA synthetase [Gammaproteobacteria bacterium]
MYPGIHAQSQPDKHAVVMAGSGEYLTYRSLDEQSNQLAHQLRASGIKPGDHISMLMENRLEHFVVAWAALRSGVHITPVNRYLTANEVAYIVTDSQSKVLISSDVMVGQLPGLRELCSSCECFWTFGSAGSGWLQLEPVLTSQPTEPIADEWLGEAMMYSSGTTGQPKGIKRPLTWQSPEEGPFIAPTLAAFGFTQDTVYLSPAPLYHAAPFHYCNGVLSLGATVVVLEKFEPLEALKAIENYAITHSQWVPTMFVRMLKLPPEQLQGWNLSSHLLAIHAAAPCPVDIKRKMIEWWGPILFEYYAASEANGVTVIDSAQWLKHPGSVGQAVQSIVRICDESTGEVLPAGERGVIYFEQEGQEAPTFEYHNSPDKTRKAQHPKHANWTTLGDVGYLSEDGFLYLTDRKAYTVISGGVNIYPQEIEDVLIMHDKVADVAVFGVPNEDFGEEVKAVVQLAANVSPNASIEQELMEYCREHLAGYKVPRSMDFELELPRLPTGKLYKRLLKDRYWPEVGT